MNPRIMGSNSGTFKQPLIPGNKMPINLKKGKLAEIFILESGKTNSRGFSVYPSYTLSFN